MIGRQPNISISDITPEQAQAFLHRLHKDAAKLEALETLLQEIILRELGIVYVELNGKIHAKRVGEAWRKRGKSLRRFDSFAEFVEYLARVVRIVRLYNG